MVRKDIKDSDVLDPINTNLVSEIRRRAVQFFVDAEVNMAVYSSNEMNKVLQHYERINKQGRLIVLKNLTTEGTLVAIYKALGENTEVLDIILADRQGIESVMFESVKALVWYKWYWPGEVSEAEELGCIIDDPAIYQLISMHMGKVTKKSLESLSIFITGLIQSAEQKSGSNDKEPHGQKEIDQDAIAHRLCK